MIECMNKGFLIVTRVLKHIMCSHILNHHINDVLSINEDAWMNWQLQNGLQKLRQEFIF